MSTRDAILASLRAAAHDDARYQHLPAWGTQGGWRSLADIASDVRPRAWRAVSDTSVERELLALAYRGLLERGRPGDGRRGLWRLASEAAAGVA